jgi:hypothetical protein
MSVLLRSLVLYRSKLLRYNIGVGSSSYIACPAFSDPYPLSPSGGLRGMNMIISDPDSDTAWKDSESIREKE